MLSTTGRTTLMAVILDSCQPRDGTAGEQCKISTAGQPRDETAGGGECTSYRDRKFCKLISGLND